MSKFPYEFLIRGENGEFKGAHVIQSLGDNPEAFDETQYIDVENALENLPDIPEKRGIVNYFKSMFIAE